MKNLIWVAVVVCGGAGSYLDFPFKRDVSPSPEYAVSLYWRLKEDVVDFALELEGNAPFRWLAFGLSDKGAYSLADVCLVQAQRIEDSWIDEKGAIRREQQQDCTQFSHQKFPRGRHVIQFSKRYDTCDDKDIRIEEESSLLTLLIGRTHRKNVNAPSVLKRIVPDRLIRTTLPLPELDTDNVKTMVIGPKNLRLPPQKTTYWCTLVRLPPMPSKHHILKYEAAVEAGHEMNVHHMEVYHCEMPVARMPRYDGPCTDPGRPAEVKACRRVLAAWAMGAEPFWYPQEAGAPIGGPGYFPFVMLETHYDNPKLSPDLVDSSGIRFYYTDNLRPYDAGILEAGVIYTDEMAIPPGQEEFPLIGYCTADCSDAGLPGEGIRIFATQLHAHDSGHRLQTTIAREGALQTVLNEDNHFVTHYQEIRHLRKHVPFLPGDTMQTTCIHDTSSRPNVTLGGLGIEEEMCVNYIHYYPKSRLEVCKSAVATNALRSFFHSMSNNFQTK